MRTSRSRTSPFGIVGRAMLIVAAALPLIGAGAVARAEGDTFQAGDVFVSIGNGQVQWYLADGTLNGTLDTMQGGFTTGMAFDADGHLFVTSGVEVPAGRPRAGGGRLEGGVGTVSEFDVDGTLLGEFGGGYDASPESILFDQTGEGYVGQAGGTFDILKFDGEGTSLASFDVATETGGSNWIDLAADQCTMFYTSEGISVRSYDVCADTQLADLTSGLTGSKANALRILPTGGTLVADSEEILRLDDGGNVIQSYDREGEDCWFALNLDPDGSSFWSGDSCTADVVKFDIETGDELTSFNTGTGLQTVFGLVLFGGSTVGGSSGADLDVTETASPDPQIVGNLISYTTEVSNLGPEDAVAATLSDSLPSEVSFDSVTTTQGSCSESGGAVDCDFGDIALDGTVTVTLSVVADEEGTVSNTAVVASDTEDPSSDNNASTATSTVSPAPGGGIQTGVGGASDRSAPAGFLALVGLLAVSAAFGVRRSVRS